MSQILLCMHQADIPECTTLWQKCAHMCTFLLHNGALWDTALVYWGICEFGLFCRGIWKTLWLRQAGSFDIFNRVRLTHWGRDKMATIFTDDIFKCIFLNEKVWIPIKISLKFVPEGSINNIPALVQIMAWRRPGDKPLSEPMMFSLPTHICVTRPQWVNTLWPNKAIWWYRSGSTLIHVMACCLTAPSHKPNHSWLIIGEVLWHSSEGKFTEIAKGIYPIYEFEYI